MIYYTQCVKLHTECKSTLSVCKKHSVINHWMGVKTTHSVYVYTECKSTLGVCKNTQCNKIIVHTHRMYFYTQCKRIQNVSFLHPSSDILHCVFLHTPSVLLYSGGAAQPTILLMILICNQCLAQ